MRILALALITMGGLALPFLAGCESDHHHDHAYGYGDNRDRPGYYDDRPGHDQRYQSRDHDRDWDRQRYHERHTRDSW